MSRISVTSENGVNITVTPQAPRPIEIKRPGVQGIQGDKGDQGDAATIAVGTVTTVGPGDPAAVTNVGTPQEAVFDFSIPRGQPGVVHSVVAGSNVTVNSTDPANPVVNASGSVSSVAMMVPTGLSVSGSPITTSGTFALSYASGYQGYTTTEASKLSGVEAGADVTDAGNVGAAIHGAASKATPVDADTIPLIDSAALSTAEQNQAIGRRKSRPLGAAGVERREGVARPEFLACSVGVFVGVSLPFGRGFGRDDSCRRSSRGC